MSFGRSDADGSYDNFAGGSFRPMAATAPMEKGQPYVASRWEGAIHRIEDPQPTRSDPPHGHINRATNRAPLTIFKRQSRRDPQPHTSHHIFFNTEPKTAIEKKRGRARSCGGVSEGGQQGENYRRGFRLGACRGAC